MSVILCLVTWSNTHNRSLLNKFCTCSWIKYGLIKEVHFFFFSLLLTLWSMPFGFGTVHVIIKVPCRISRFNKQTETHFLYNSAATFNVDQHGISFLLHYQSCVTQDIQLPLSFACKLAFLPGLPWALLNASDRAFATTSDFSDSLQMKA